MERNVKFENRDGRLVASLVGEVDHHAAAPMREAIDSRVILDLPKTLVLDFGAVPFMDSSGIGLILGRWDLCQKKQCDLVIDGLSGELSRLIALSGVEKLPRLSVTRESEEEKTDETHHQ